MKYNVSYQYHLHSDDLNRYCYRFHLVVRLYRHGKLHWVPLNASEKIQKPGKKIAGCKRCCKKLLTLAVDYFGSMKSARCNRVIFLTELIVSRTQCKSCKRGYHTMNSSLLCSMLSEFYFGFIADKIFCDFGEKFMISDTNGEQPISNMIAV